MPAAALATFAAVVTLLGAQMRAGHDPVLGPGQTALVRPADGSRPVVTRTSGGAAVPSGSAGTAAKGARKHAVVTRTSGGGGGSEESDDE